MSALCAANLVRLIGGLLFAVPALELALDHGVASLAHRIVGSAGLALLAISAALDAARTA
jgi:hypothetical protein